MNLNARIGLLIPELTPLWTGTADGAQSSDFVLTVTTLTGALAASMAGLVLVREGVDQIRIKTAGGVTLTLAENHATFAAGDSLAIYALRLPFPRYQRLYENEVFKDWDIPFPAAYQATQPPSVVVTPEVLWTRVGETTILDATATLMVHPPDISGDNDVTMTYDAAGWATATGYGGPVGDVIDPYCSLTPTAPGFHYLKCTGTDDNGVVTNHYVPVWVGTDYLNVLSFSLDWSLERGWRGSGETDTQFDYVNHSPVAIVDLDTRAVLLFGFLRPQTVARAFGTETFNFEVLSPLQDADLLAGYPFLVEDVADPESDPPTAWSELGEITVPRAAWFLLVWHTMLPELVNVDLGDVAARRIKGQKFSAGTLPNLLKEVLGAAYYVLRTARTGGARLDLHPLYAEAGEWDGSPLAFAIYDLSDPAGREEDYELQLPAPRCIDVRASGVYFSHSGDFEPAIARCPTHPAPWGGTTAEITNLAPLNESELHRWAARHFAVENLVPLLTLHPLVDVDPFLYPLIATDVAEASLIALETLRLSLNTAGMQWDTDLSGRPYGEDYAVAAIPIPPVIEIPAPTPPPIVPPVPPLPPLPEPSDWPTRLYVATTLRGVYYTENFSGPEGEQPTWTKVIGGASVPDDITCAALSSVTETLFVLQASTRSVWRKTLTGDWEEVFTESEATTLLGGLAKIYWIYVDTGGVVYAHVRGYGSDSLGRSSEIFLSNSDGELSSWIHSTQAYYYTFGMYSVGDLVVEGTSGFVTFSQASGGGKARVAVGAIGSDDWPISTELGGNWLPVVYRAGGVIWSTTLDGALRKLSGTSWLVPTAAEDYMCGRLGDGRPKFYSWDATAELVTVGLGGTTHANKIFYSDDAFETKSTFGAVGREIDLCLGIPGFPPNLILARNDSGDGGAPHVVFVSEDLGETAPVERAGSTPQLTGTTNSIPYDCGGVAGNGLLPVYDVE